jgi:hypothetical protein
MWAAFEKPNTLMPTTVTCWCSLFSLDSTCRARGDHTSGSHSRKLYNSYYGLFRFGNIRKETETVHNECLLTHPPPLLCLLPPCLLCSALHWIARPENREQLETEIRKAHVICIVYAIDDPNTFNRLPLFWLPYIRSLGVNVRGNYLLSVCLLYSFHNPLCPSLGSLCFGR